LEAAGLTGPSLGLLAAADDWPLSDDMEVDLPPPPQDLPIPVHVPLTPAAFYHQPKADEEEEEEPPAPACAPLTPAAFYHQPSGEDDEEDVPAAAEAAVGDDAEYVLPVTCDKLIRVCEAGRKLTWPLSFTSPFVEGAVKVEDRGCFDTVAALEENLCWSNRPSEGTIAFGVAIVPYFIRGGKNVRAEWNGTVSAHTTISSVTVSLEEHKITANMRFGPGSRPTKSYAVQPGEQKAGGTHNTFRLLTVAYSYFDSARGIAAFVKSAPIYTTFRNNSGKPSQKHNTPESTRMNAKKRAAAEATHPAGAARGKGRPRKE
jgi:hypothetical protein